MSSRYFSPVEGHAVSRFGHPDLLVGAERDRSVEGGIRWADKGSIVEIPEPEAMAYQREYDRAVRDGGLLERKAEEFEAYAKRVADAATKSDAEAARAKAKTEKPVVASAQKE